MPLCILCVAAFHFPGRIVTPLLQSWSAAPRHQPMEGRLAVGKQLGSMGNLSTVYLSLWGCADLAGSLAQRSELPQEFLSPSPLQGEGGERVEIAKLFLLLILVLSCLKPAGTVDDEDSALFLSPLLPELAAQGGSFPGEIQRAAGDCLC